MKTRSAVVIVEDGEVALIQRERGGRVYYLFPGGGVEEGETAEEAAVREAREELGLEVCLGELVARVEFGGNLQLYYVAFVTGGEFGSGLGEELSSALGSDAGTYTPVWLPVDDLAARDVRPSALATALAGPAGLSGAGVLRVVER